MSINILMISILIGVLLAALSSTIIILIYNSATRESRNAEYRRNIASAFMDEYEDDEYTSTDGRVSLFEKWFEVWGRLLQEVSKDRYSADDKKGGYDIIVATLLVGTLTALFASQLLAGVVIALFFIIGAYIVLRSRAGKKDEKLLQQLTGFLHGLKANVSADQTPEQSLIRVLRTTQNPLREEMADVEKMIRANISFRETMHHLRENSSSQDLQFLAACIIQGSKGSGSLAPQLDTIIDSVDSAKRRTEAINRGEKNANLSIKVVSAVLPGAFVALYLMDQRTRDFWFIHPLSWPALLGVVVIYAISIFMARRAVSKVRDLN